MKILTTEELEFATKANEYKDKLPATKRELILAYAEEIKKAHDESPFWGKNGNTHEMSVEFGSKFAKISMRSHGQKSVHCFVEIANGDIHKAATYKAPQKNGVRGNLVEEKRPLFGADYYAAKTRTIWVG